MLVGRYIDHSFCDKKDLGMFHKKLPQFDGSVISTCHRVEVIDTQLHPGFQIMGYESRTVSGNRAVCLRIARIASGVESVILGEPFVFDQVKHSFDDTDDPEILKYANISLDIAQEARDTFDFYSHLDYSDIAINLLESDDIIVMGSGMLANTIIDKLDEPMMISRRIDKNALTLTDLPEDEFQCIIATTGSSKYRRKAERQLNKSNCSLVVDLSSVPFIKNPEFRYITMYDDIFENEINRTNNKLQGKVKQVKQFIHNKVYETI